eukprot:363031-Chlamydomonas_euryale.AAC.4
MHLGLLRPVRRRVCRHAMRHEQAVRGRGSRVAGQAPCQRLMAGQLRPVASCGPAPQVCSKTALSPRCGFLLPVRWSRMLTESSAGMAVLRTADHKSRLWQSCERACE